MYIFLDIYLRTFFHNLFKKKKKIQKGVICRKGNLKTNINFLYISHPMAITVGFLSIYIKGYFPDIAYIFFWVKSLAKSSSLFSTSCQTRKPLNIYPDNKLLDQSNLKEFADDKINVTLTMNFVMGRVETILGKGENADNQHFLLFPQCFFPKRPPCQGSFKVGIVSLW